MVLKGYPPKRAAEALLFPTDAPGTLKAKHGAVHIQMGPCSSADSPGSVTGKPLRRQLRSVGSLAGKRSVLWGRMLRLREPEKCQMK